jgi:hypothetical protein
MSSWRIPLAGALTVVLITVMMYPGCGRRDGTSDTERRTARAVTAVVSKNITAQERGDARTYCSTYTEDFLREHLGGSFEECTKRFSSPTEKSALPGPRFFNAVTFKDTDTKGGVHFKIGQGEELLYELELTDPPPGSVPGKRWLIYAVAPPVRD